MTRWKVRRTAWGWSLYHDDKLVGSADNPLELVIFPAALSLMDDTRDPSRQ